jgi:hypothetical protein
VLSLSPSLYLSLTGEEGVCHRDISMVCAGVQASFMLARVSTPSSSVRERERERGEERERCRINIIITMDKL